MRSIKRRAARIITFVLAATMLLTTTVAAAKIGEGKITADALRVRESASTTASVLTKIPYGTTIDVLAEEGEWYLTSYSGYMGYVHKTYVDFAPTTLKDLAELAVSLVSAPTASAAAQAAQQDIVDEACRYLGVRYRYGGSSLSGFDCSGFTSYVYKAFGYSLERTASGQLNNGTSVNRAELQMGDLVFFRDTRVTSKPASHVGIYIGNNKFVHASSSSTGYVLISSLDEAYFARYYVGARRVLTQ